MSDNDKNVPLIVYDFHTKWGKRDTISFPKEISRFHIWSLESGRSLGRKVPFFEIPWDNQDFQESKTLNFQEQIELCFYFKYSRSYKAL